MSNLYQAAVVMGRWQIFHLGHESLLQRALECAERVVVVIGSAFRSRNASNPFNWQERRAMIELSLSDEQRARVVYLPVRDYFDDVRWNAAVKEGVSNLIPGVRSVALFGFKKDHSSYYLENFPQWTRVEIERSHMLDATSLRHVFFGANDEAGRMAVLKSSISHGVAGYLQAWALLPDYEVCAREHHAVVAYRKKYGTGPFLTADAVVTAAFQGNEYVLLVRRKAGTIGEGLWAIPGGFLEAGERLYDGCVRELEEETSFKPLPASLRHAMKSWKMFDHPNRSPRAHLVTGAFHFNLGEVKVLPEVKGQDDVDTAKWFNQEDILKMDTEIFEDHNMILDSFIDLYE